MGAIVFTSGATVVTLSSPASYPAASPPAVSVLAETSEAGAVYAYDKGVLVTLHRLSFAHLTDADAAALEGFFSTTVVGPKTAFTYTDADGDDHTVRWMDTEFPIEKTGHNQWGGVIRLREEVS